MTRSSPRRSELKIAEAEKLIDTLTLMEKLKAELRHSWLSDGRQESVADHSWMMAMAAVLIAPHLEHSVDLGRTLMLVALHDVAEAITGDIPCFEESARKTSKFADEAAAIETLRRQLPEASGNLLFDLWQEYEEGATPEAKFARALDKLEVQQQHNLADLRTWTEIELELVYTKMDRECEHDRALITLLDVIRLRAESKMKVAGIEPETVRARSLARLEL